MLLKIFEIPGPVSDLPNLGSIWEVYSTVKRYVTQVTTSGSEVTCLRVTGICGCSQARAGNVTALWLQVPCHAIAMAPNLGYYVGQLSALQGLDVHGFEGSASAYASLVQPPSLLSLTSCNQLHWLDISHWTVTEPEVSKGLTAVLPSATSLLMQSYAFAT